MDPVQFTAMMVLLRQTLTAAMQGGARTAGPDLRLQRLTKMMAEDQPEAYLEVFKVMATSAVWPQAQWANYLLPQLTGGTGSGENLVTYRHDKLPHADGSHIRNHVGATPEGYRRKFRDKVL